jgi:hypothetical protein
LSRSPNLSTHKTTPVSTVSSLVVWGPDLLTSIAILTC